MSPRIIMKRKAIGSFETSNYLPAHTVKHPRRIEPSATPL
jgi:hypothetical protein